MKQSNTRIVGLDVHPDSFAGAILAGRDPASARVLSTSTRVELKELEHWAERHTSKDDMLVLEASGNAFAVAGRLRALGRPVAILDSHQAGKIGKVYCANDRVDAVIAGAGETPRKQNDLIAQMLAAIARDLVPERPGRSEPRAKKRRSKNYQLLTQPRHKIGNLPRRNRPQKITPKHALS